jgi:hypothetical protein
VRRHRPRLGVEHAPKLIDDPSIAEPTGDDEHQSDDDRGRVAEPLEGFLDGNQAQNQRCDQRAKGYEIVAPSTPYEHTEDDAEQCEEKGLV